MAPLAQPEPDDDEHDFPLLPLTYTYIRIGQDQFVTGDPYRYLGSIAFPACTENPNKAYQGYITARDGFEVYQVLGNGGTRIVHSFDSGPRQWGPETSGIPIGFWHPVFINETIEAQGSLEYRIHHWNQLEMPSQSDRVDRWFNMTFVPKTTRTVHEEGTPCTGGLQEGPPGTLLRGAIHEGFESA